MSNRQELCYGWDVFEKFIICIAWYLKTLRLNGASAWLRVSTVPIYHGMLHLCVISHLKERQDCRWVSLCFKNVGSWCAIWLLMDTRPGGLVEGYLNDLNASGLQGRNVSVCGMWEPGSGMLGGRSSMGTGVASFGYSSIFWWYLRVKWVFCSLKSTKQLIFLIYGWVESEQKQLMLCLPSWNYGIMLWQYLTQFGCLPYLVKNEMKISKLSFQARDLPSTHWPHPANAILRDIWSRTMCLMQWLLSIILRICG